VVPQPKLYYECGSWSREREMQTGVVVCSRLGMLLCWGLLSGGCSDSGSGASGTDNQPGSGSGSSWTQHLEEALEATTSNSVLISFKCSLDYTVDIGASSAATEAWVRDYLDSAANSAVFAHPFQAFLQDDSLLSELVTEKMTKGVVGLPGVHGTPAFDATCGDMKLAEDP
jgi:hypothetical protein